MAQRTGLIRAKLGQIKLSCGSRELEIDRQLSDLGITREQIPVVVGAYPVSAELLTRMLARLGITEETIARNPGLRSQLEHTCSLCFLRQECKCYLKLPVDALPYGYQTFCPNTAKLDELRPCSPHKKDPLT